MFHKNKATHFIFPFHTMMVYYHSHSYSCEYTFNFKILVVRGHIKRIAKSKVGHVVQCMLFDMGAIFSCSHWVGSWVVAYFILNMSHQINKPFLSLYHLFLSLWELMAYIWNGPQSWTHPQRILVVHRYY